MVNALVPATCSLCPYCLCESREEDVVVAIPYSTVCPFVCMECWALASKYLSEPGRPGELDGARKELDVRIRSTHEYYDYCIGIDPATFKKRGPISISDLYRLCSPNDPPPESVR